MKRIRNLAAALCTVVFLSHCATQDEVNNLNYQVRVINQKLEDVKSTTVNQMQKRQASSVNQIDELHNAMLRLQGVIDENAHQESRFREQSKENLAGLQTAMENNQAENDRRLKFVEEKINHLAVQLDKLRQARLQDAEQRAREAAWRAEAARKHTVIAAASVKGFVKIEPAGRKTRVDAARKGQIRAVVRSPAETSTSNTPASRSNSGGDRFSQALKQYKAQHYADAYKTFERVLSENPRGEKAVETLFLMGESLFAQGEYDLAILDYQKVISNYPHSVRAPAALLKQGVSFDKLTDHETAKIIYKKLLAEYPNSKESAVASRNLKQLKQGPGN